MNNMTRRHIKNYLGKTIKASLACAMLILPTIAFAQDDLYFTPTKEQVAADRKERAALKAVKERESQARELYYSGLNKTDDEYNRRPSRRGNTPVSAQDNINAGNDSVASDIIHFSIGDGEYREAERVDTVYKYVVVDDDDYIFSRCLARFDDFYWWARMNYPFYSRPLSWYAGWVYPWYDPWFDPWYDPWYHRFGPWYDPWCDPWYPGVYWGHYYYGGWHYRPTWIHGGGGWNPSGTQVARTHPYKGYSTHSYKDMVAARGGNANQRIAARNGDATTRHTGVGYRGNSNRGTYRDNSYSSERYRSDWNNQPSRSFSNSSSGMSGGSRGSVGGHSMGGGRSVGGGSFGGGRRR